MSLKIRFSKMNVSESIDYTIKLGIRRAIEQTLLHERFPYPAEVSVSFSDNEYIRKINKKHRNIDKPTDVLSFPMYPDGEFPMAECSMGAWLGDVVISLERAREQAKEYGNTPLREICFLSVHSTLHLLGYDHERSKEEDELQCEKQRQIMKKLESKVNLDD